MAERRFSGLVAGLLALVALPSVALAQDEPVPPRPGTVRAPAPRLDPTDPDYRGARLGDSMAVENDDVRGEKVVFAVGGVGQPVWIKFPGFELRCTAVVIWGDKERLTGALVERSSPSEEARAAENVLGPVIHAIYAEGDVYLDRSSHRMTAERVMIDFAANQAYIVNARMRGSMGSGRYGKIVPLTVRAAVIRGVARDKYVAENPSFTTSTYATPQLDFTTDWLEVEFDEDTVWFETGWWPLLRMDTALGPQTPVLVLPKLGGRNFDLRPLQDASFGSSSRFGTEVELQFGGDLEDEQGKWGDWTLYTGYRSDRGGGAGLDFDYEGKDRRKGPADEFELRTYFQHDTARKDDYSELPFDGLRGGDSQEERGRAHVWFRKHLSDGWRLDGEVSYYSDRGFLAEYYRDETLDQKQQETFLHARKTWGTGGVSFLASHRLNEEAVTSVRSGDVLLTDFQNQTEVLPGLTYHLVNHPLVTAEETGLLPFNLSLQGSVGRLERRYDDEVARRLRRAGWSSEDVWRGDLEGRLTTPFSIGPVHVNPAVGGSLMVQDASNGFGRIGLAGNDDKEQREAGFWSVRADVEFHRVFDVASDALDLNGLRHVISFDAHFFDRFHVGEGEFTFQHNDQIDGLVEQQVGTYHVRNRLQTRRDGEVVDVLDLDLGVVYFHDAVPRRRFGAFGVREDFAQPLQRLDLPGEDKYRTRRRDGAAFYTQRARLQVLPRLWLVGEGDYDADAREFETTLAGVRFFWDERLSVFLGRRTIRHDSRLWTLNGDYRYSAKWGFGAGFQHDNRRNEDFETRFTLYRREPDYTVAVEFENEGLLDETSISLAVYPNDWLSSSKRDPFRERRPLDFEALRWYR